MMDVLLFDLQILMKIVFIVITVLYVIFAIIVVKQVQLMSDTIKLQFERYLIVISYLHLIVAFGAMLITIFIL